MSGLRLVTDDTPRPTKVDHAAQLQAAIVALRRATASPLLCESERDLVGENADLLEMALSTTKAEATPGEQIEEEAAQLRRTMVELREAAKASLLRPAEQRAVHAYADLLEQILDSETKVA